MNLFFGGGSLASAMKPYFWQRFGVKNVFRNMLKQNIFCKSLHAGNFSEIKGQSRAFFINLIKFNQ
jgi:hypothetical protein